MTAIPFNQQSMMNPLTLPLAIARSWRYAAGTRDLRLDLLRGFACFAMIVDHVGGISSWLYPLTGGNRFFVSAEAFVFIAGLTMGTVYAGIIAKQGAGPAVVKALRRAGSLYVLTLALTFSFAAVSVALDLPWAANLTRARRASCSMWRRCARRSS